jgi:hypothetical protein
MAGVRLIDAPIHATDGLAGDVARADLDDALEAAAFDLAIGRRQTPWPGSALPARTRGR